MPVRPVAAGLTGWGFHLGICDDLIANDDAFERWIGIKPQTDTQQLRALIRQARKDQEAMVKAPAGTPAKGWR